MPTIPAWNSSGCTRTWPQTKRGSRSGKRTRFTEWGDNWTFEEMEEHAQWELLVTIILAGAMTEVGAKIVHTDFQAGWLFNDDFVTTIFEVK